ncbi:MAG TPA: hypothetical protein VET88_13785 [Gammaproteobacteria bacterium]|nr:hypothetical protein [Gammaproteobacteria bacterium]
MARPLFLMLACLLLFPVNGHAEHPLDPHSPPQDESLHLSPELAGLLRQEMNAVEQGMQALVPAIVAGNWQDITAAGENIRDSYILQQQLTDTRRQALHRELPAAFLELDQSFHHAAGMLAHAAQQRNAEVVNFYFYKLMDACVACHRKYAGQRFPGLAGEADAAGHRH